MAIIDNSKSNTIISGTSGSDSINNKGNSVTIKGGAGNDFLRNLGGDSVTIYGGTGNDTIYSGVKLPDFSIVQNVTINGGAGNDSILSASNKKMYLNATAAATTQF